LFIIFAISERRNITKHKTPFTHRSTIIIKNVQKSDAQNYVCTAISNDATSKTTPSESVTYKLTVHGNYNISIYLSKIILRLVIYNNLILLRETKRYI